MDRHYRLGLRLVSVFGSGALVAGLAVVATGPPAWADPAPACSAGTCTVSYAETGAPETFTVPPRVTSITVTVEGAQGGQGGGFGGQSQGTLAVVAGDVYTVVVGQEGSSGSTNPDGSATGGVGGYGGGGNGGNVGPVLARLPGAGGGGGSFFFAPAGTPLLVAGGGGSGAGDNSGALGGAGGTGGGADADGSAGTAYDYGGANTGGGEPASASAPGSAGAGDTGRASGSPGADGAATPAAGPTALGTGGAGGDALSNVDTGYSGGGGGGGYYGGGGGGGGWNGGGGGGGSGYADASLTDVTGSAGHNGGDGQVVISYADPLADIPGGGLTPPTTAAPLPPSPKSAPTVQRIGGLTRDQTAADVAMEMYPPAGSARTVVLVRDDTYADGLTASSLATALGGPLLFTPGQLLSTDARLAITRLLPTGGTVHIVGGPSAISAIVVGQLTALGYRVDRIGGPNRFATAALVADAIAATPAGITHVYLASGTAFGDALSAAAAASASGGAVLLTAGLSLPPPTKGWLSAHPALPVTAIGELAAAADPSAPSIAGLDPYATAALVAATMVPTPRGIVLSTGTNFSDGLAAAVLAAQTGSALLLTDPTAPTLDTAQTAYLHQVAGHVTSLYAIGGSSVLPPATVNLVQIALSPQ